MKTFKQLEHEGWVERAASYDVITPVTNQAIAPLLATCAPLAGRRLLEVASGPGHLAARAQVQGADVDAVDFAATMVSQAQAAYPDVRFHEGDAEALAFEDGTFDCVICAFGLLHLEFPERALSEACRVLRPGGRYTWSVWCAPEQGGDFFGLLMGAIQQHGDLNVPMPPAPSFYRFADPDEASSVMTAAGFNAPEITTIPVRWTARSPQDAVDVIYKATVRTKALMDAQTAEDRDAIHAAIIKGIEAFRVDDGYEVALPAVVVTATKP